jgi:hypothetical protein
MKPKENCENTKLVGYDPTAESAVLCNEPGEYCAECEMVLCPSCHEEVATHAVAMKKPPARVTSQLEREVRKSR